jgi:hypothetical protein
MAADRTQYTTYRRHKHKTANKDLSGYALDWTIRFNHQGAAFLSDHNGGDPMVFNNLEELRGFLDGQLDRHYAEHFGVTV